MRLRQLLLSLCTITCLAVATGCGKDDTSNTTPTEPATPPPTAEEFYEQMIAATSEQESAHYSFEMEVVQDEPSQSEVMLRAEGDASADALTLEGEYSFGASGQSISGEAEVMADSDRFFVKLGDQWYGQEDGGLDELLSETAGTPTAEMQQLRETLPDLIDSEVEPGPTLDGQETWQISGQLDEIAVTELSGETLDADERELLQQLDLTVVINQEDSLLRRVEFGGEIDYEESTPDLGALSPGDDVPAPETTTVRNQGSFMLSMEFSDWGQEVVIEPPTDFRPFEQLPEAFEGLGFGSSDTPTTPLPQPMPTEPSSGAAYSS